MIIDKVYRYLHRVFIKIYIKVRVLNYKLLSNQRIERKAKRIQAVQVLGPGRVLCGNGVKLGYYPSPYLFSTYCYLESRSASSLIQIGDRTHINNGFVAIAEKESITIGKDCLIGPNVQIYDSDFHAISYKDRQKGISHKAESILIGDNVFIGSNVVILKGVSIGNGSVLANGSVVTKKIPNDCLAAGIPAKVISQINNE